MPDNRLYAIGDIHGHLDKLKQVHDWIARDQAKNGPATIVHVGDLVDRGPDSKGVIDYLIAGRDRGEDWVVLKGNHDRMMSLYLQAEPQRDPRLRSEFDWLHPRLGGIETLESYGLNTDTAPYDLHKAARSAVPQAHFAFLQDMPILHQQGDVACVHAGIRPGLPLDQQVEDDLIWIRDEFHLSRADHGPLIIHGHTPVDEVLHYGNRVNIDTGAAYGGPLSAIVVEGREVAQISKRGRKALPAPRR